MDRKSEWALGEFRDPPIELRLLGNRNASEAAAGKGAGNTSSVGSPQPGDVCKDASSSSSSGAPVGGRRRVLQTRSAYQGERIAGLLVVKFEAGECGTSDEERRSRWRQFGTALNVELEITTEAAAAAGTAFLSEEPSLWRDYEGRENARDRGVLARSNRTVSLSPESFSRKESPTGDLVYALEVEVQVPVEFLGQRVYLEALVSPVSQSQRESGGNRDSTFASSSSINATDAFSAGPRPFGYPCGAASSRCAWCSPLPSRAGPVPPLQEPLVVVSWPLRSGTTIPRQTSSCTTSRFTWTPRPGAGRGHLPRGFPLLGRRAPVLPFFSEPIFPPTEVSLGLVMASCIVKVTAWRERHNREDWTVPSNNRSLPGEEDLAPRERASQKCSAHPGWRSQRCRWSWLLGRCRGSCCRFLRRERRLSRLDGRAGNSRAR
ncbi:unnamed protein product [Scytosiphon promiscuus]